MAGVTTIPLVALSSETRFLLSSLLNPVKEFLTCDDIPRDWRGIADMFSIGGEMMPSITTHSDPTGCLFELITDKNPQCTLKDFCNVLEKMDRWDIIHDTESLFEKDTEKYLERMQRSVESAEVLQNAVDHELLTIDDLYRVKAGLKTQVYDAFLLCTDDNFTQLLIENLEKKYNLKICIKDRDLISGVSFEHEAIMQLISERCNRLLVVISPNFLKSPENKFFLNYAQAIGIEKRQRKIIPCLYQSCEIPPQLRYTFLLDYNKPHLYDFWKRLADSIATVNVNLSTNSNCDDKKSKQSIFCEIDKQNSTNTMKENQKIANNKSKLFSWSSKKNKQHLSDTNSMKSTESEDNPIKNLPSLDGLDSLDSSTSISLPVPKNDKKKRTIKSYAKKIKSLVGSKS